MFKKIFIGMIVILLIASFSFAQDKLTGTVKPGWGKCSYTITLGTIKLTNSAKIGFDGYSKTFDFKLGDTTFKGNVTFIITEPFTKISRFMVDVKIGDKRVKGTIAAQSLTNILEIYLDQGDIKMFGNITKDPVLGRKFAIQNGDYKVAGTFTSNLAGDEVDLKMGEQGIIKGQRKINAFSGQIDMDLTVDKMTITDVLIYILLQDIVATCEKIISDISN